VIHSSWNWYRCWVPSSTTMTAASPPVTQTGLCGPATTGRAAATASSSSFSRVYQRWLVPLLRSYQPIWSSKRCQVGSGDGLDGPHGSGIVLTSCHRVLLGVPRAVRAWSWEWFYCSTPPTNLQAHGRTLSANMTGAKNAAATSGYGTLVPRSTARVYSSRAGRAGQDVGHAVQRPRQHGAILRLAALAELARIVRPRAR
jgi:hypothetical protein